MTTTLDPTAAERVPDASRAPGTDPRSRGHLVLERKVIERVAAQVASESDSGRTGGVSGGFLGFGTRTDLSALPATSVELVGRTATVRLDLTVAYPTPIRTATDQIRRRVMSQVRALTGVEVTRVDITVTALTSASSPPARKVQ
jgi:uncharacterized alkaline shock family protein YloU